MNLNLNCLQSNHLGSEDETLTMDNILTKGSSLESLEDDATDIPSLANGLNAIASPEHGAYDDLD